MAWLGLTPALEAHTYWWAALGLRMWRVHARQARRKACNECNAGKDGLSNVKGAASGTQRLGEGGGFREYDAVEDERRKMRAQQAASDKEQRKAEKKKCPYCSRFSCIC